MHRHSCGCLCCWLVDPTAPESGCLWCCRVPMPAVPNRTSIQGPAAYEQGYDATVFASSRLRTRQVQHLYPHALRQPLPCPALALPLRYISQQQDQCPDGAVALLYNNGTGYAVQCYLYLQGGPSGNLGVGGEPGGIQAMHAMLVPSRCTSMGTHMWGIRSLGKCQGGIRCLTVVHRPCRASLYRVPPFVITQQTARPTCIDRCTLPPYLRRSLQLRGAARAFRNQQDRLWQLLL